MSKLNLKGQTLLELVVGLGLLTVIVGALAIVTTNSLRNSQFSKNQVQATKLAQENMEKVRTIKSSDFGVCLQGESVCSTWENIWAVNFGRQQTGCTIGCTFYPEDGCTVTGDEEKPLCLRYQANPISVGENFTGQIIIEDEDVNQKRVTSRVSWVDATGNHSSELVTILSRI